MGFESLNCHLVRPFLSQNKLACHEAVTVVQSVLQELLGGILNPERAQSPVDTYLTEEDVFHHRNPQVQAQHGPYPVCVPWVKGIANPPKSGTVLSVFHESLTCSSQQLCEMDTVYILTLHGGN